MKESRGWGVRMEDLRAPTFRGVRRLVVLACMAYGYMAELQDQAKNVVERVVAKVKAFGKVPD